MTAFLQRSALLCGSLLCTLSASAADSVEIDAVRQLHEAYIPKREIGQTDFLREHPEADGRGIVIAIFDTGVDPAAAGLSVTSTGERKILEILDATGSGDVDTSKIVEAVDGSLAGLSGTTLRLSDGITNPSGEFRVGLKAAADIFPRRALGRLQSYEAEQWKAELSRIRAERERLQKSEDRSFAKKAPADQTLEERDRAAREEQLQSLEDRYLEIVPEIHYDCVVWNDGEFWRVIVDTDRDGDLADESALRPYGIAGEYSVFDDISNLSFGVQVYEEGDLLSLVTVSGTHGSHVASIAAAHFPGEPERSGIAPGAQVVSIRIGDPRTGGSSTGISERRAAAMAAQLGVDVVNASWGGHSVYQDGHDANSETYDMLVERYGIFAVVSAGNDGPALSTLGSAGGEARRVLGVGAYVSPEMGKVLYSTLQENGEAALQFSSRGPTKDGDWGVDITAPGAALASYSRDSLQRVEMSNGTSMSAPSAAGAAALLLSAARERDLAVDPARLRSAMMLGSRPVPGLDDTAQGAGLVNVPDAWEKLEALAGEPAFGAFYDFEVSRGTFAEEGRGFYLREPAPPPRNRVVVRVQPEWIEAFSGTERADFEIELSLRSTVDWIEVPELLTLANADNHFIAHVTTPPLAGENGSIAFGEVEARLVGREALGPVFTVPFTVVRGADGSAFVNEIEQREVALEPGRIERWFFDVPAGADHLQVKLRHRAEDPIARRYVLHGVTLAQEVPIYESGDPEYMRLDEGEERTFLLPTTGGRVMELALYQYWSSVGPSTLEVSLQWQGLGLSDQPVLFAPNAEWAQLPLRSLRDQTVAVEGSIDTAMHVHLPKRTQLAGLDERAEFPGSPLQPEARRHQTQQQFFEFTLKEPMTADLWYPQDYDTGDFYGGGLTEVYHESGKLLYRGSVYRDAPIKLPKGKLYAFRQYDQPHGQGLDEVARWPLLLAEKLDSSASIPVHASLRDRFSGSAEDELELRGGAPAHLYLRDRAGKKLGEHSPRPAYFTGELTFEDESERTLAEVPVRYFAGELFEDVANQEPEEEKAKDPRDSAEKLADALYDQKLAFVRDERGNDDEAIQEKRAEVLERLRDERPEDPAPVFEVALDRAIRAGLAGEWWKGPEVEATDLSAREDIDDLLAEAERLAEPAKVAEFFGAKPQAAPGDFEGRHAIERREKELGEARDQLVSIAQLRADLALSAEDYGTAWKQLTEVARWESKPGERTLALKAALHRAEGHLGLALESLEAQLEEDPFDRKLLEKQVALYRELGWERFADAAERELAIRAAQRSFLERW